jgi:hypothetical protein
MSRVSHPYKGKQPAPMNSRCKTRYVLVLSNTGIVGSNPARAMDICPWNKQQKQNGATTIRHKMAAWSCGSQSRNPPVELTTGSFLYLWLLNVAHLSVHNCTSNACLHLKPHFVLHRGISLQFSVIMVVARCFQVIRLYTDSMIRNIMGHTLDIKL